MTSDICSTFFFIVTMWLWTCLSCPSHKQPLDQPLEDMRKIEKFWPKVSSEAFLSHRAQQKVILSQFTAAPLFFPSVVDSCVLQLPSDRRSASHWPFLAVYWVSEQDCAVFVWSCSSWQLTGPQRWSCQSASTQVKRVKDGAITLKQQNNTNYLNWYLASCHVDSC